MHFVRPSVCPSVCYNLRMHWWIII